MPNLAVIVDTSCLIALDEIHLLHLLDTLYDKIIVPKGVHDEFGDIPLSKVQIQKIDAPSVHFFQKTLHLGKGESEVLSLALSTGFSCLLDDQRARKVARNLGLNVSGTIGILVASERKSLIFSAYEQGLELKKKGFYVSEKLLNKLKGML